MSYAIHIFFADKFSTEPYQSLLAEVQNLYGNWDVVEYVPFDGGSNSTIHEVTIQSKEWGLVEGGFRVWIKASRMSPHIPWGFDYEWDMSFETSAGRSELGLAVQLGSLLLAAKRLRFLKVIHHDGTIKDEPTEFGSIDAVAEHVKKDIQIAFPEYASVLAQRGIIDDKGYFVLAP